MLNVVILSVVAQLRVLINIKMQQIFMQSGLNEADTLKSSLILIYSHQEQGIYTQLQN